MELVSMLWNCSSQFLCFHQIIEDSNCLSSENKHFDYNLSGRYALDWNNSRGCSDVLQYSDPHIAVAGVCDKSKEVGDDPSQETEFLGMVINSKEINISFPEQKLQNVKL